MKEIGPIPRTLYPFESTPGHPRHCPKKPPKNIILKSLQKTLESQKCAFHVSKKTIKKMNFNVAFVSLSLASDAIK